MLKTIVVIDGENVLGQARSQNRWTDWGRLRDYVTRQEEGRFLSEAVVYLPIAPNGNRSGILRFHDTLRRKGFRVVTRQGKARPDGTWEANLDTDIVVGTMEMVIGSRPDIVVLVSADSHFDCLCEWLRRRGTRAEVASLGTRFAPELRKTASALIDLEGYFRTCKPMVPKSPHGEQEGNGNGSR